MSIKGAIKRSPMLHLVGKEVKRAAGVVSNEFRHRDWKRKREPIIAAYLAGERNPKLHVGCGPMVMAGWLNTDIEPRIEQGVIYLDIREKMPLPEGKFQFIYSEHVVEHISLEEAFSHFKDCFRILRPGGVLRVAMPDLQFLLDYCSTSELSDVQQAFLDEMMSEFHPGFPIREPSVLLNDFVRKWNHQFIYDRRLLRRILSNVGFLNVADCDVMESSHAELVGLERHGSAISEAFNRLQTMVVEAEKPVA